MDLTCIYIPLYIISSHFVFQLVIHSEPSNGKEGLFVHV